VEATASVYPYTLGTYPAPGRADGIQVRSVFWTRGLDRQLNWICVGRCWTATISLLKVTAIIAARIPASWQYGYRDTWQVVARVND
jgi:hypothetical protein